MKLNNQRGIVQLIGLLLVGLAIGVVILVVMLLKQPAKVPLVPSVDRQTQELKAISPSDEIEVIEVEVENTNLDQIDAELSQIEADLPQL